MMEIRDPLLHPPRVPWGPILFLGLDAAILAAIAGGLLTGSLPGAFLAGAAAFALATGYLALQILGPWAGVHAEYMVRDLERRFAPPREVVIQTERPEPTRILNGVVLIGAADAARPDGDRALRELLIGFARAAQVHGWGIRDLVGLRIRTSAGEIQITDPLWRAVTDALEGRGLLRKSNAGTFLAQDIEAVVAWAREGRIPPEVRHRLAPYLILPPSPAPAEAAG